MKEEGRDEKQSLTLGEQCNKIKNNNQQFENNFGSTLYTPALFNKETLS